jgi:opacity protein-like surface antigen
MTAPAQSLTKKYCFYIQGGYMSSLYVKKAGQGEIISETEARHHKCIILNAGIQVNLSKKWKIGLAFTYDHFGTKHRSVEFSTLSYLLRCDRTWKETKKYTLYSGLSLGVRKSRRFENEVEIERKVNPGYQIYLMGANYKITDRLFFDVNAGWGVSGTLNAGLKYRF